MSSEERQNRRIKNDRMELAITVGLFITMAVLVLVGIWMVSRVPPQMQTVAQGVFYSTIVLGFGQVLLLVKAKLVHKDVADDLDTTVKVAEKVNGGTALTLNAMTTEHDTSIEALRSEWQRERHSLRNELHMTMLLKTEADAELKGKVEALAKAEVQVKDLTEKLARCAELNKPA